MIVIVGAGPAGLAMAYQLQRHGLPFEILERHTVGHTWQQQYDSLHLHTLKGVSALPGLPMPQHYPDFPSATQVHAYLNHYARHFQFPIRCGVEVQHADWDGSGWQIRTSQGVHQATTLVVASGIWSTPYRPAFAGEAQFGGKIEHAQQYRNPQRYRNQRVLVVGVGNSGAEIAVELAEAGIETAIAVRGGARFVAYPTSAATMQALAWLARTLPPPLVEAFLQRSRRDQSGGRIPAPRQPLFQSYPVVGFELPHAAARGQIAVYGVIDRFVRGGVRFADGQTAHFDSVILATGYRPSIGFLNGPLDLDAKGRPQVDSDWRAVWNPHLYCVGFEYPTTEGWLQSIGRVAQCAAAAITTAPVYAESLSR